jgi:hypothetical protein
MAVSQLESSLLRPIGDEEEDTMQDAMDFTPEIEKPKTLGELILASLESEPENWRFDTNDDDTVTHVKNYTKLHFDYDCIYVESDDVDIEDREQKIIYKKLGELKTQRDKEARTSAMQKAMARFGH